MGLEKKWNSSLPIGQKAFKFCQLGQVFVYLFLDIDCKVTCTCLGENLLIRDDWTSLFSSPVKLYKREEPASLILGDPGAACREIESCNSGKTLQKRKQEPLGTVLVCANAKLSLLARDKNVASLQGCH